MSKPYQEEKSDWLEEIQSQMKKDGLLEVNEKKDNYSFTTETDLKSFFEALEALKQLAHNL